MLSASVFCSFDMVQLCHVLSLKLFTLQPSFLKSLDASCVTGLCKPMCPIGNQGTHMHFLSSIVVYTRAFSMCHCCWESDRELKIWMVS
jgi:hypothetical protein